jgi:hypothetical protein
VHAMKKKKKHIKKHGNSWNISFNARTKHMKINIGT